jgi:hypothetical protein
MDSEIGFVYLIKSHENQLVKIGFSKNPVARLEALQTSSPTRLYFLATLKCENPRLVEKSIHTEFISKKVSGEWFSLSDEDIAYIYSSKEMGLDWEIHDHQWLDVLMCQWKKWEVVSTSFLRLTMAPGHCCDMAGCIKIASILCPAVEAIATYSGAELDTFYFKQQGQWQARQCDKKEIVKFYPKFINAGFKNSVDLENKKTRLQLIKDLKNFNCPENLYTPDFEEAWCEWWDYISTKKKDKLNIYSAKIILQKFSDCYPHFAIKAIKRSIANGWLNIYTTKEEEQSIFQ